MPLKRGLLAGLGLILLLAGLGRASADPPGRTLVPLNGLPVANVPSTVTAIVGYSFDPGDLTRPIEAEALQAARATVRRAAEEGALWLDADMGITNTTDAFLNDPALTFYPLAEAIIDEAHRYGIKVFFYFSGAEIETLNYSERPETAIERVHPDWLQVDQHGQPMAFQPGVVDAFWLDEDTADAWANPLAPGYRAAILARAEGIARLGADGLWIDVPYYFSYDDRLADFSAFSATAFRAATGLELPYHLADDGVAFQRWLDWRPTVWRDFLDEIRARAQAVQPDLRLIVEEWPGYSDTGTLETGYDTVVADVAIDIAGHEFGHRQDEGGAIAFTLDDWQFTRDVYKRYQAFNRVNWSLCYASAAPDSRALAAITYAHQLSFWETQAPTMLDATTDAGWRAELLRWIAAHASAYDGAQPAAEVAVIYSGRTRNQSGGASLQALADVQHGLDAAGLPYVILTEQHILDMHAFPYVIFPEVTYATEAVRREVARYGGTLLLIGNALTRDAWDQADLVPPVAAVSIADAVARIATTPIRVEGGEGLFVELFRQGDQMQARLFNPVLDADFQPEPRRVILRFVWPGDPPTASALAFLGEPVDLTPVRDGETISLTVDVGLFTTVTIGGQG